MRFAEDMLLNAKLYGLVAYNRRDRFDNRCALGLVEEYDNPEHYGALCALVDISAEEKYPWIASQPDFSMPCNCGRDLYAHAGKMGCMISAIAHLFNEHVMQAGKYGPAEPWTMERLADWIDSVDPTPRETSPEQTEKEDHGIADHEVFSIRSPA